MQDIISFLEHKAYLLRYWSLVMTTHAGSGHPTSCLSAADIVAILFFDIMRYDPANPQNPDNDRFILSKGHASALLYAVWKQVGVISQQELLTYRSFTSVLEGHPTLRFSYNEAATGSLGIGLSIGLGIELARVLDRRAYRTYVLLGDSELAEGSVWEAVQLAAFRRCDHLIAIVDNNGWGQSVMPLYDRDGGAYARQFAAFGWHVLLVDGHDIAAVRERCMEARDMVDKPTVIIARTHKGYGIKSVEDKNGYHGKPFPPDKLDTILNELKHQFPHAAAYKEKISWSAKLPDVSGPFSAPTKQPMSFPLYERSKKIAVRKAYGDTLCILGSDERIVVLDAEVKNSTYAEEFEHMFPDRFIECFIAEQNMVSIAVGLASRKKISFAATFGAFFTRAHDQIRMAAIGQVPLRLVGTHAGVSIGADGPSQMALEDIALFRALPESIVLYPCDAISTQLLLEKMYEHNSSISYLRATRGATPIVYDNEASCVIGGCTVLRSSNTDIACVIVAGITVHEALGAYEMLQKENISIAIIDLYSIKPLDSATIIATARCTRNRILTFEDHYPAGGLGEAVLAAVAGTGISVQVNAVPGLPRSGSCDELLAWAGIDAAAIVRAVKMIKS